MAAEYQLIATDLKTGIVRQEVPWLSFSISERKNAPNSGTFTFPLRSDPVNNLITEENLGVARTGLVVLRGGIPLGRFLLQSDSGSYGAIAGSLTMRAIGTVGYLAQRRMRDSLNFEGVDQFTIVRDLVEDAQKTANGDIDLRVFDLVSGVLRDRKYEAVERTTYLEAINEFANSENGFDWFETTEDSNDPAISKYFTTLRLRSTSTNLTDVVFDLSKNLESLSWGTSSQQLANVYDAFSKSVEGAEPIFRAGFNTASLQQYPQYDGSEQVGVAPEASNAGILQERANQHVRNFGFPTRSYTAKVRPDIDAPFTDLVRGNVVKLNAKYGYLDESQTLCLIQGRTLGVSSTGKETVTVELTRVDF